MMRKTSWYSILQQPVHVGWYDRVYAYNGTTTHVDRDWWDGTHWRYDPLGKKCYIQWRPWRGLKEPYNEHIRTR